MWLPLLVAFLILGLAYLIFYMGPVIFDFGKSFMAIVVAFLILFTGAAFYVMYSLPAIGSTATPSDTSESVLDVTVSQ